MLPFAPTAASQIRYLLESAKDSDPESIVRELCQFVEYGNDGAILLMQTCLELMNLGSGEMQNMHTKQEILSAVFRYLLGRPSFSSIFCQALRNEWMNDNLLLNLSKVLNLSASEKIGIGLALTDSENFDFKLRGQNFCIAQIEEICANPIPILSHQQIQEIFMFLHKSEGLSKHMDSFMKMLSLLQLKETSHVVLGPVLEDDAISEDSLRHLDLFDGYSENDFEAVLAEIEKEMSMADIIRELGYGCTTTISHCKEMLSLFMPLDELTICKILCTIACTHIRNEDGHNVHSTFCSAVGINSTTDSSVLSSWNIDVLVDSFKQLVPETNWIRVMENMDHEGFSIPDEQSFLTFMSVYARACQDPFPLHAVCASVWKNAEGQISFLKYAVSAPSDVFTFAHSGNKLPHVESTLPNSHGNEAWYCLDLLDVLSQLCERGHASAVQSLLESPLKQLPELLLLGVAHTNSAYNLLQYEVSSEVFPMVARNPSKSFVVHQLWHINHNIVLRGFMDMYSKDPENIIRILDLCEELKILSSVLETMPFSFSIKLAAVAYWKEYINLEKWLNDHWSTYKDAFFEHCLGFLKGLISDGMSDQSLQHLSPMMNIYQETVPTFLKGLQIPSGVVSPHLSEEFRRLCRTLTHTNPRMQNIVASESAVLDGSSEDIDDEANSYFHKMFSEQLSVDAMVQTLARFKESSDRREQLIFECMIGNLFEEYKFFPKYPDRQLKIAAILFGSLIKHQLVTHLTLGIALRCVLDALRKSVDSKMFVFGAKALEQFMDRLIEWPQYCNHILQIQHLRSTHTELVSVIERALAQISSSQSESNSRNNISSDQNQLSSMQPPVESIEASEPTWPLIGSGAVQPGQQISSSFQLQQRHHGLVDERLRTSAPLVTSIKPQPSGQSSMVSANSDSAISQKASGAVSALSSPGILRPSRAIVTPGMHRQPSYSTGFGAPMNIETLVAAAERRDTPIEVPASEIQDKILFMINNISATNMDAKSKEFTEILNEQYYPWFAQYMVMKRASIEPNFHDLYLKFLDKVNSKLLNKEILKATYENCKVLLRSDLIKSSSEERSLLKNLGSWLGKFTIGRNQALRAREIDPKVLIIEAYERGLMIAVIPFTSKILEPCQNSLAYKPPNPWTMGILSLLMEIYNLPSLKMNLKFDIEVLFKNLSVDLKDVKPTALLMDRARELEGNPDFSTKDITATQTPIVAEVNTGMVSSLSTVDMQADVSNTSHLGVHPNVLSQFTALHLASSALAEEEKMGALGMPDHVPSGQGLSQVTPSQTPFSISQSPSTIPNIGTHVVVNPKLNALGLHLQFQRVLPIAMEKAIREIISPVVQRSITIASQTTRELVLKDYAMESDESRIYNAAHLMVASLAGSLAHVTCKEPLRIAMSGNLRTLLQPLNVGSELLEQAVQLVTNDNLDLGCAVIEQAATEKALQNIDGEIAASLTFRRKQRESTGAAYYDAGTYAQSPFARVPEALRPKPGRLSIAQQRVYEDFVRLPWQNQAGQGSNNVPGGPSVSTSGSVSSAGPHVYGPSSGQLNSTVYLTPHVTPGFSSAAQPLDLISEEMDSGTAQLHSGSSSLGMGADVAQQTAGISTIAASFPTPPEDVIAVVPPSPSPAAERLTTVISEPLSTGDALDKYQLLAQKLESMIAKDARDADIQGLVAEVPEIILKCVSRDEAALAVAQKVFKALYDNPSNSLHVGSHLSILSAIRDVCKLVVKELTSWVIYSDDGRKFNKEIIVGLIRSELVNLAEYNVHLAKLIDGGRNKTATEFAIALTQTLVVQEPSISAEMLNTIDSLSKLLGRPGVSDSLVQLFEILRNTSAIAIPGISSKEEKTRQTKEKKIISGRPFTGREDYNIETAATDPPGFRDQVSLLFGEWFQLNELPATDAAYTHYISQLQQNNLLKGDERTDSFFRILMELAVAYSLASEQPVTPNQLAVQSAHQLQHLSFVAIDAYAKLIVLVLKYCLLDQGASKVALLPKILSVAVNVIQKDAEDKKSSFNPRPYFRVLVYWLWELNSSDPILDAVNFQVLTSFANAFHALQPLKVPGLSFAWLELISHRSFMPRLLTGNSCKGWPFFQRLLVDLFKFMEPCLRNVELGEAVRFLYKGTLRVLLVLLHDFPDFLCEYHFSFCDVIPPTCIQMRNVILSAFPPKMRLPDPSTPNLKIDLLAEISQSPRILSDIDGALKAKMLKADVDEYLKTRPQGSSFLTELKQRLILPANEAMQAGSQYNVPLINSLVLYVGIQAIQQLQNKSPQHVPAPQMGHPGPADAVMVGAAMDIFRTLAVELDTEGRYLFLNAVANQLRYPNNNTHYFSFVLLFLFFEAKQEIIQEQITRVLLERLIVNRPHPWGLLITFIELIKNERYAFWKRSFTHSVPEISKLFDSVSRSCGGPKAVDDSMVAAGISEGNL